MGPLKVFDAFGNWPYCIHLLSNYGIFVYCFSNELNNRTAIFPDYKDKVKIEEKLILRLYFDQYYSEIAGNAFGYAFITRVNTSSLTFDTYLGAVAFYQGT